MRLTFRLAAIAVAMALAAPASAQTTVKGRALVIVDSSGSMAWHFGDCTAAGGGDSGANAAFCDNNIGTAFACNQNVACTTANGAVALFPTTLGTPSRLYAAKAALQDVLAATTGYIDYGLERYAEGVLNEYGNGVNICPDASDCCTTQIDGTTRGRCIPKIVDDYVTVPSSLKCYGNANGDCNLTFAGGCGTSASCASTAACQATEGGQLLVQPAGGSSTTMGKWIDFVEDFCSSNGVVGGPPRNPELRAVGGTPLAGGVRTARKQWYQPVYDVSKVGAPGYNMASPLFDAQLDCRSYVNVVMTDGAETCEAAAVAFSDPQQAVQELTNVNAANPVKTYVIGVSFAQNEPCNNNGADSTVCPKTGPGGGCNGADCSCNVAGDCGATCDGFAYVCGADHICHHPALASLNAMAAAGGTGSAKFANNQADIEAAFADIVSSTVKVEKCNNADDDCNLACDEPFPDVAVNGAGCTNPRAAKTCDNGARAGTHCFATGNFVCSADTLSEVCSAPKCPFNCPSDTVNCPTNPLCATAETCNGLDDDCNGVIDDCTAGSPNTCSCASNCPACAAGGPFPETCNGCDDDCDGIADNHLVDTGIACGANIGICMPGTTFCCKQGAPTPGTCTTDPVTKSGAHVNPDQLFCLGGVSPAAPACNGCDNDCDGQVDKPTQACYSKGDGGCTFAAGMWTCKGICQTGAQICSSAVCPSASMYGACVGDTGKGVEVCNGLDDDCDGTTDVGATDVGGDCCPTGNLTDCDNTNGGTHCKRGKIACVAGAKVCQNAVAKAPETCNNVDDDCNNTTDDVPGIGAACTGPGIKTLGPCKASYVCMGTMPGTGPNGLTCKQTTLPGPETCNGIDDDCDGTPDNNLMDPQVGVVGGSPCMPLTPLPGTMFPNGNPQPPCMPGITACVAGMIVCQGEVQPSPNQCGGISTDCTGNTNQVTCPSGFQCVQGNCVQACSGGEFPCPGGFVCDTNTNLCIPDKCQQINCQPGFLCNIDSNGDAHCIDPCTKVNCGSDYQCVSGSCVDCHTFGCPSGQLCIGTPGKCQPDPCAGVMCPQGQFCDTTGQCSMMCTGNCPPHEICLGNTCQLDPCFGMTCNSDEVCTVQGNPPTGVCVTNMCSGGCSNGMTCCGGTCRMDRCELLQCPQGATCILDSACDPTCATPSGAGPDQVVGAGGGGTACSTVPGEAARGSGLGLLLLVLAAMWLARRGRAEVR